MGLLPEWYNKGDKPMGNLGQFTESNMFTNPTYEQQSRMGRMAQMLRNPQQPQMPQQMQGQPMQGMQGQQPQDGMLMNPQNQLMTNWNQQYGGY